ncbi:hypothetical protein P2G88_02845 [Aliiglaciecola sp. CAU 1673]|uniref:hypothetical protein n=1 Tax=Aliiglaciecola sp. CAU 1673 TaxID=3032595 RepID=UPI0023DBB63A|nr:hypothetical protein [Aliiglaciecola sp. CAU 1673]MDF2177181.1 hypothetical protein [Aliiglaciecola sp. CAU 1673]
MITYAGKSKDSNTKDSYSETRQRRSSGEAGIQDGRLNAGLLSRQQALADDSVQSRQLLKWQNMADGHNGATLQRYTLGTGTTRNVTLTGANGNRTFEECTYNYVDYKNGDAKQAGSSTSSPASWADWVTNKKGGRNASQLHIVNRRWGGLGGQNDKNIVPGSPAENSHHLHEAEKKFDQIAFNNGSNAVQDAKYECWAAPKYGTAVNVSGGNIDVGDPSLNVTITTGTGAQNFNVTDGSDGLTIKDGS